MLTKQSKPIDKDKLFVHTALPVFTEHKERLSKISNTLLMFTVINLFNKIKMIENTGMLSALLVQNTASQVDYYRRFQIAVINKKSLSNENKEIEMEMERLKGKLDFSNVESVLDILNEIMDQHPDTRSSFTNQFRLNTVFLWTIFEAISCDLWILSINKLPRVYAKNVLLHKKEIIINRIFSEFIKDDYKLDLSNNIGDFLVQYYDFSGVSDVRKSYEILFNKNFKDIGTYLKTNIMLNNLQHIRNLIVHKAGIVDNMFISQTNLKFKVGEEIEINGELYAQYSLVAIDACVKMIEFINEFFNSKNLKLNY